MAENDVQQQEPTQEPQGTEVDWEAKFKEAQAESRKWESRAKANKEKADLWDAQQQDGSTVVDALTKRAEEAEAKVAAYEADEQHRADAAEVAGETSVPVSLLLHCKDRTDMEAFAKEFAAETKVPAAPKAPESRIAREGGAKASTADQFAEMADRFFRH